MEKLVRVYWYRNSSVRRLSQPPMCIYNVIDFQDDHELIHLILIHEVASALTAIWTTGFAPLPAPFVEPKTSR